MRKRVRARCVVDLLEKTESGLPSEERRAGGWRGEDPKPPSSVRRAQAAPGAGPGRELSRGGGRGRRGVGAAGRPPARLQRGERGPARRHPQPSATVAGPPTPSRDRLQDSPGPRPNWSAGSLPWFPEIQVRAAGTGFASRAPLHLTSGAPPAWGAEEGPARPHAAPHPRSGALCGWASSLINSNALPPPVP